METIASPKVQINQQLRTNAEGEVIERSLLLNIREDNVIRAVQLYRQLNDKMSDSVNLVLPQRSADNEDIKVENIPFPTEDEEERPDCPYCGDMMVKRRSKDGNQFWGCPNYRSKNCRGSRPIY